MGSFLKWFLVWLMMTLGITAAGAFVGALVFPVGGLVFGYDLDFATLVWNGIKDGGFFAFIWAPGISFVACIMLIRNKSDKNADHLS